MQEEIRHTPGLVRYGVLILDVRCDEYACEHNDGASTHYKGLLYKVETSQVGVFLAYANCSKEQSLWTWVEGDLF